MEKSCTAITRAAVWDPFCLCPLFTFLLVPEILTLEAATSLSAVLHLCL